MNNKNNEQNNENQRINEKLANNTFQLILNQVKYQFFNLLYKYFGETSISIYEFKTTLNSILYQLQLKEKYYRNIPKELIELFLDKFLPNAQQSRSLVQFIVNELKRVKMELNRTNYNSLEEEQIKEDNKEEDSEEEEEEDEKKKNIGANAMKRAFRVIIFTIMKLLESRFIPIPNILLLDDDIKKKEKNLKKKELMKRINWKYKSIVNFTKDTYKNYYFKKIKKSEWNLFSFDLSNSIVTNNNNYNSGSNNYNNYNRMGFMNRSFSENWNNRLFLNNNIKNNYIDKNSNILKEMENYINYNNYNIGPLTLKFPFYRQPKGKLEQLQKEILQKEIILKKRIKKLQELENLWENENDVLQRNKKHLISLMITKIVTKLYKNYYYTKRNNTMIDIVIEQFTGTIKKPNDQSILNEYFTTTVTNNNLQKINDYYIPPNKLEEEYNKTINEEMKEYLRNLEKKRIKKEIENDKVFLQKNNLPNFFNNILNITIEDIKIFQKNNSINSLQKEQLQFKSFQFLKELLQKNNFTYQKFFNLVKSDGPLHQVEMVQNLLKKTLHFIENDNSYKDIVNYLNNKDKEVESIYLLYKWVTEGHEDEFILKDLLKQPQQLKEEQQQSNDNIENNNLSELTKMINDYIVLGSVNNVNYITIGNDTIDKRIEQVRNYCIDEILNSEKREKEEEKRYDIGPRFILQFINSLEQTIQYERIYPSSIPVNELKLINKIELKDKMKQFNLQERENIIKEGALKYIEKYVCKNEKQREWFKERYDKFIERKEKERQEEYKKELKKLEEKNNLIEKNLKEMQQKLTQEEEIINLTNLLELEMENRTISNNEMLNLYDKTITRKRRSQLFQ
ncbi:hypothetical protein ABK040_009571 [Willaertia magna]